MPNLLHGIAFGAGLAIGFFVVELALQELWYRYCMRRIKKCH